MTVARVVGGVTAAGVGVVALALAAFATGSTLWTIAGFVTSSSVGQILAAAGFGVIIVLQVMAAILAELVE